MEKKEKRVMIIRLGVMKKAMEAKTKEVLIWWRKRTKRGKKSSNKTEKKRES